MANAAPNASAAPAPRAPKAMSSRLLTMKFMQRAASISHFAPIPTSSATSPPSKRRKTLPDPEQQNLPEMPVSDIDLIKAALMEEQKEREEAVERMQEERGEGKWLFSLAGNGGAGSGEYGMKVEAVGWEEIDGGRDTEDVPGIGVGRRSWGGFDRGMEKRQRVQEQDEGLDSSSSSSSEEEIGSEQESDELDSYRIDRKSRRKEKRAEAARLAESRKSKVVKLNKLSAISGGGGGSSGGGKKDIECYRCGEMGHRKSECEKGKKMKAGDSGRQV